MSRRADIGKRKKKKKTPKGPYNIVRLLCQNQSYPPPDRSCHTSMAHVRISHELYRFPRKYTRDVLYGLYVVCLYTGLDEFARINHRTVAYDVFLRGTLCSQNRSVIAVVITSVSLLFRSREKPYEIIRSLATYDNNNNNNNNAFGRRWKEFH